MSNEKKHINEKSNPDTDQTTERSKTVPMFLLLTILSRVFFMYNISFKAYRNEKLKHIHNRIDTSGYIWNHCLALQKRYYKLYGGYISCGKMQKHIAKLRKKNSYWQKLNAQSVQEICQRMDSAYNRFFKKKAKRPPKFKKVKKFNSFVLKQVGWKIQDNILIISKTGKYKFSKSREYENIKRITVKRNSLGEIFFILCCDMDSNKYKREGNSSIGIDFGLKTYLTCSDGKEYQSPLFFKQEVNNIKKANRNLSTKKKGSNNRRKAKNDLARIHKRIANKRKDFHWKLAHELCRQNQFIAIEDLNIDAMIRIWGRKVSDLSFSSFVVILEHVAKKYGTTVQKIGRFYPSSRTCGCGSINKELKLSDREWVCSDCGAINKRDDLASKNILSEGIRLWRTKCKTSSEAT